jgi:hypothetical protein
MALKTFIKTLEEVGEAFRSEYKKTDDGYVLDTDDSSFQQKIGEFRNNNITLQKQIDELNKTMTKYKGVDPEKYATAMETLQKLEEKQLLEAGQVDKVIEQRTAAMRSDYEGQITSLNTLVETHKGQAIQYKTRLDDIAISTAIQQAVNEVATPRKGALEDIQLRARTTWKVGDDGNIVPMSDGKVLYGKDGKAPMTPQEWVGNLTTQAAYLFEPNSGGGSQGTGAKPATGANGSKVLPRESFSSNLEAIAKGTATVTINE